MAQLELVLVFQQCNNLYCLYNINYLFLSIVIPIIIFYLFPIDYYTYTLLFFVLCFHLLYLWIYSYLSHSIYLHHIEYIHLKECQTANLLLFTFICLNMLFLPSILLLGTLHLLLLNKVLYSLFLCRMMLIFGKFLSNTHKDLMVSFLITH